MGLVSFNSLHTNDLDKHTINWYTHNTGGKVMNDEIQIQVLHQMFFELATKLMEDGVDPIMIASCMTAGGMQLYQKLLPPEEFDRIKDIIHKTTLNDGSSMKDKRTVH